ncbi:hypothetical protein 65p226 [Aeromonas phage 65]|uniref:Uncharacterized protein n=2 Tax=Ishigurovirus osborne TaxID=260149 RepID=A0A219YCD1_9CAUD|nr:hypothetical protein ST65p226 [Aeromonas phage 65]ADQ53234.1 hypothetical protein 65p226 [Aeromonas phage 65]APU01610.1 hypothetical protein [Aeromonas phage 65.2]
MSSGKATIRSTAKHSRRKVQDRRVIKRWLLQGNNFSEFVSCFNTSYDTEHIKYLDRHGSGIGIRIYRFMKENGFLYTNIWSDIKNHGPFIIVIRPKTGLNPFLRKLGIVYSVSGLNYEILRNQDIEPKPVKPRSKKPETRAVVPVVSSDMGTDEGQVVELMKKIKQLDKERFDAELVLDGIEHKLKTAKKNLKSIIGDYIENN